MIVSITDNFCDAQIAQIRASSSPSSKVPSDVQHGNSVYGSLPGSGVTTPSAINVQPQGNNNFGSLPGSGHQGAINDDGGNITFLPPAQRQTKSATPQSSENYFYSPPPSHDQMQNNIDGAKQKSAVSSGLSQLAEQSGDHYSTPQNPAYHSDLVDKFFAENGFGSLTKPDNITTQNDTRLDAFGVAKELSHELFDSVIEETASTLNENLLKQAENGEEGNLRNAAKEGADNIIRGAITDATDAAILTEIDQLPESEQSFWRDSYDTFVRPGVNMLPWNAPQNVQRYFVETSQIDDVTKRIFESQ